MWKKKKAKANFKDKRLNKGNNKTNMFHSTLDALCHLA